MASLAGMLKARGFTVTGSDEKVYPPMSTELERLGIPVALGYDPAHLQPHPDIVVVGNAIPRGNLEVEYTLNTKLRYRSMPEIVKQYFIEGRRSLVVAGTHGKTTTSSLMAWTLQVAGLNPSFLIGGVAENFGASFQVSDSEYFVIEGDEYDTAYFDKGPKFMHYLPEVVLLNNIEFDHADIYPNIEAITLAFRRLINLIPSSGRLIAGVDSPLVGELLPRAFCPVVTYSTKGAAQWEAREILFAPEHTQFGVYRGGEPLATIRTPLSGAFNVRNCLAVIIAAFELGVPVDVISNAMLTFKSVKRRMQVRGEAGGITVIDDFAHHPTAVRETLLAVSQKYAGRRIVAAFEPRSWSSRKKVFQGPYENAFDPAAIAVIAPVFESHKLDQDDRLDVDLLVRSLAGKGIDAAKVEDPGAIVQHLLPRLRPGDVVVVMSNGAFGGLHNKLLNALRDGSSDDG